ncbi:Uncharacterized protein Fot_21870 [Forsythia ovata]|uniref:Transposase n=1 Tax=Forsythia ovata TaxID=205694 RepID=A0ABD1UW43_9LAMI
MSLLNGLVRIKNMEDVKIMLDGIGRSTLLEVYLVSPARTFVLSWESLTVKWKTNVVIEEIVESDSIRVPESQPLSGKEPPIDEESEDVYVPQSEEQEWDGVNWVELIDGVCSGQWDEDLIDSFVHRSEHEELRPDCEDQGNVSGRPEHLDHIGASENDNLVDSDYETNEENEHESQPTAASLVNIDMSGLGDLHDEAVEKTYTDYGDSDELESLGSDGEFRCANIYKEFEFNANVDLTNPQFKTGSRNFEDKPLPQTNIKHQLTHLRWQARKRLSGFRSVHEVFSSKGFKEAIVGIRGGNYSPEFGVVLIVLMQLGYRIPDKDAYVKDSGVKVHVSSATANNDDDLKLFQDVVALGYERLVVQRE